MEELAGLDLEPLVAVGAVDVDGDAGMATARFALYVEGDEVVVVPNDAGDASDRVYFGRDSTWLAALAERYGSPTGPAADLGTGAGSVALALARTHDPVVATDLVPRTAACAALTMDLNRRLDGRPAATVVVTDVAAGLAPGSCSVVTANPPWMPAVDATAPKVFAEGGATGFELWRRFAMEAVELLAPDGVAVVLGLDSRWADGSRPLLALARGIARLGHDVAVEPTDAATVWPDFADRLRARFLDLTDARHVALLVRRRAAAGAGTG